jgi:FkbM family methyltransferase
MYNISLLGSNYGKHAAVLDKLSADSLIYSFGVGCDITFDLELISRVGCDVYGFDPTPRSIQWYKDTNITEKFKFFEFGISNKDGSINFSAPQNKSHVSFKQETTGDYCLPVKCISTILSELHHKDQNIDLLKLDVEGSEYEVIEDLLVKKIFPSQMTIEFHNNPDYINWLGNHSELKKIYDMFLYPSDEVFFIKK